MTADLALIPDHAELYGAALALLADVPPHARIVDLGEGQGHLAPLVGEAHPTVRLERIMPGEPCDAVIADLVLHRLDHGAKRALFGAVAGALRPGGRFVAVTHFSACSPAVDDIHRRLWETEALAAGASPAAVAAARDEMAALDRNASLDDLVEWLEAAGLSAAEVVYRNHFRAVLGAVRQAQ